VITPRVQQTHDLFRRLVLEHSSVPVQLLKATESDLPEDIEWSLGAGVLPPAEHVRNLSRRPGVVIGTAEKFLVSALSFEDQHFDLLVCDEAYQLAYKDLAPLFRIAGQTVTVGDPGQLMPLVKANTAYFEAARYKMHWPAPREILRRFPNVPTVKLPASWRLPQDSVGLVQPSLYTNLEFVSAARDDDRRVEFRAAGINAPIDKALDMLARGATIVGILLPATELPTEHVDEELSALQSAIVRRLFERGGVWKGQRDLSVADIGCVDSHVASSAATERYMRLEGFSTEELMVSTPEVWQGSQRPLMIVKNPVSGVKRLDAFSLDPGRLCVMLSRHQLGCIVVGRDGFTGALEAHQHDCANRFMGAADIDWKGWQAHSRIWTELERMGRFVRM
jgi:hypothetical protein